MQFAAFAHALANACWSPDTLHSHLHFVSAARVAVDCINADDSLLPNVKLRVETVDLLDGSGVNDAKCVACLGDDVADDVMRQDHSCRFCSPQDPWGVRNLARERAADPMKSAWVTSLLKSESLSNTTVVLGLGYSADLDTMSRFVLPSMSRDYLLITPAASSSAFSDKALHPNVFRVAMSLGVEAHSMVDIVHDIAGQTSLKLLHCEDEFCTDCAKQVRSRARDLNMTISQAKSYPSTAVAKATNVLNQGGDIENSFIDGEAQEFFGCNNTLSRVDVVVLCSHKYQVDRWLLAALRNRGPDLFERTIWVTHEWGSLNINEGLRGKDEAATQPATILSVRANRAMVNASTDEEECHVREDEEKESCLRAVEFKNFWKDLVKTNKSPAFALGLTKLYNDDPYVKQTRDAVYALAYGLDSMRRNGISFNNVSALKLALKSTSFFGVSIKQQKIAFDDNFELSSKKLTIRLKTDLYNSTWEPIAEYDWGGVKRINFKKEGKESDFIKPPSREDCLCSSKGNLSCAPCALAGISPSPSDSFWRNMAHHGKLFSDPSFREICSSQKNLAWVYVWGMYAGTIMMLCWAAKFALKMHRAMEREYGKGSGSWRFVALNFIVFCALSCSFVFFYWSVESIGLPVLNHWEAAGHSSFGWGGFVTLVLCCMWSLIFASIGIIEAIMDWHVVPVPLIDGRGKVLCTWIKRNEQSWRDEGAFEDSPRHSLGWRVLKTDVLKKSDKVKKQLDAALPDAMMERYNFEKLLYFTPLSQAFESDAHGNCRKCGKSEARHSRNAGKRYCWQGVELAFAVTKQHSTENTTFLLKLICTNKWHGFKDDRAPETWQYAAIRRRECLAMRFQHEFREPPKGSVNLLLPSPGHGRGHERYGFLFETCNYSKFQKLPSHLQDSKIIHALTDLSIYFMESVLELPPTQDGMNSGTLFQSLEGDRIKLLSQKQQHSPSEVIDISLSIARLLEYLKRKNLVLPTIDADVIIKDLNGVYWLTDWTQVIWNPVMLEIDFPPLSQDDFDDADDLRECVAKHLVQNSQSLQHQDKHSVKAFFSSDMSQHVSIEKIVPTRDGVRKNRRVTTAEKLSAPDGVQENWLQEGEEWTGGVIVSISVWAPNSLVANELLKRFEGKKIGGLIERLRKIKPPKLESCSLYLKLLDQGVEQSPWIWSMPPRERRPNQHTLRLLEKAMTLRDRGDEFLTRIFADAKVSPSRIWTCSPGRLKNFESVAEIAPEVLAELHFEFQLELQEQSAAVQQPIPQSRESRLVLEEKLGDKSQIYSLGVFAYRMITSHYPCFNLKSSDRRRRQLQDGGDITKDDRHDDFTRQDGVTGPDVSERRTSKFLDFESRVQQTQAIVEFHEEVTDRESIFSVDPDAGKEVLDRVFLIELNPKSFNVTGQSKSAERIHNQNVVGDVRVTVQRIKYVEDAAGFFDNDPVVCLTHGNVTHKTSVKQNVGGTIEFNEMYTFQKTVHEDNILRVNVMDSATDSDTFIGRTFGSFELNLNQHNLTGSEPLTINIPRNDGLGGCCEVILVISTNCDLLSQGANGIEEGSNGSKLCMKDAPFLEIRLSDLVCITLGGQASYDAMLGKNVTQFAFCFPQNAQKHMAEDLSESMDGALQQLVSEGGFAYFDKDQELVEVRAIKWGYSTQKLNDVYDFIRIGRPQDWLRNDIDVEKRLLPLHEQSFFRAKNTPSQYAFTKFAWIHPDDGNIDHMTGLGGWFLFQNEEGDLKTCPIWAGYLEWDRIDEETMPIDAKTLIGDMLQMDPNRRPNNTDVIKKLQRLKRMCELRVKINEKKKEMREICEQILNEEDEDCNETAERLSSLQRSRPGVDFCEIREISDIFDRAQGDLLIQSAIQSDADRQDLLKNAVLAQFRAMNTKTNEQGREVNDARPGLAASATLSEGFECMKFGDSKEATKGLRSFIGLENDIQMGKLLKKGIQAIQEEFVFNGSLQDLENFFYICYGVAQYKEHMPAHVLDDIDRGKYHGGPLSHGDFDFGNKRKRLADFVDHQHSKDSNISESNVLCARLYTCSSYKRFNNPLRQAINPHPFKMTVYYLDEGLRQLRTVEAMNPTEFSRVRKLYRGIRGKSIPEDKMKEEGVVERAPMSTSADRSVAEKYARVNEEEQVPRILLEYNTKALSTGTSIKFLSVYPKEEEILYPPLTRIELEGNLESKDGLENGKMSVQIP